MKIELALTRKQREPKSTQQCWWIKPKYLIDIRINKAWMAFRLCLANPLRLRYNRQVRKRHNKLKEKIINVEWVASNGVRVGKIDTRAIHTLGR